ncbi:YihY/virulence factor BrkB family protein [Fulvitalea axinellae]
MKKINFSEIEKFFTKDIWVSKFSGLSRPMLIGLRVLRIVWLAVKGFFEDRCMLQASGLTYYTLLSVVPVLALAFAIAKGFGYDQVLEREILSGLEGHEQVAKQALEFARSMLKNTKGGPLAVVGIVVLLYSTMSLLFNIEEAVNDIWDLRVSRPLNRKLTDYLTILISTPLLVIIAGSMTVYISGEVENVASKYELLRFAQPLIYKSLKLTSVGLLWIAFTMLFYIMPYTKVSIRAAFISGAVTGTAFHLLQWGLIAFQIGVARYNAIYGSFAALPLFLLWLQLSWSVILFGAELAYAIQHVRLFTFSKGDLKLSVRDRHVMFVAVCRFVVLRFMEDGKAPTASDISRKLQLPLLYVQRSLGSLVSSGLLSVVKVNYAEAPAYQPALDPNKITLAYALEKMDDYGKITVDFPKGKDIVTVREYMDGLNELFRESDRNKLLHEL